MKAPDTTVSSISTTTASYAERRHRFEAPRMAGTVPVFNPATTHVSLGSAVSSPSDNKSPPAFRDMLDSINPLQHLPVVGSIYRKATGDEISPVARVIGGAIFGGPIGGAFAIADVALEAQTGKSVEDRVMALVSNNPENKTRPDDILLTPTQRQKVPARMAGTMPVWGQGTTRLATESPFEALLAQQSGQKINIS